MTGGIQSSWSVDLRDRQADRGCRRDAVDVGVEEHDEVVPREPERGAAEPVKCDLHRARDGTPSLPGETVDTGLDRRTVSLSDTTPRRARHGERDGEIKFTFGNLPSIGWSDPAGKLVALARFREEVTGLRIHAVPPAGKPLFDGYVDMVRGFGKVAALVNKPPVRGSIPVPA